MVAFCVAYAAHSFAKNSHPAVDKDAVDAANAAWASAQSVVQVVYVHVPVYRAVYAVAAANDGRPDSPAGVAAECAGVAVAVVVLVAVDAATDVVV